MLFLFFILKFLFITHTNPNNSLTLILTDTVLKYRLYNYKKKN